MSGQPLIPIGTVYDPFVCRGLDAVVHATDSGSRFIIAGTPSGVTLAPEGGAHQSTVTASIGLELPGTTLIEPAYGAAPDWLLCDAGGRISAGPDHGVDPDNGAYYFRLTTRPIDQEPFEAARARLGDAVLRRQVLAGAYRLLDAPEDLAGVPTCTGSTTCSRVRSSTRHWRHCRSPERQETAHRHRSRSARSVAARAAR
ncbi:hypothetical protein OG216_40645 [Streptomycetaceae bacterium NBC_01309]